jgi:hypothetical protein
MAPLHLVALGAALLVAPAVARPLTDAELTALYGYARMDGPTRVVPPPLDANETLKSAAARAGVHIGAAINYAGMAQGAHGAQYPVIALSQLDLFTAENECKVGSVRPGPTTYSFGQCE